MANALIVTKSNAQINAEEKAKAIAALPETEKAFASNLANYIRKCWDRAVKAKQPIADEMLESLRQRKGEYKQDKLDAIKSIGMGAEVFMMITSTKCRSGEAWVREILFRAGEKPWDIEATPIPELPKDLEAQIKTQLYTETAQMMAMQMAQQGIQPNPQMIAMFLAENQDKMDSLVNKIFTEHAKDKSDKMEKRIEDQLVEGGWYKALNDSIYDIITLKAGFIKGPVKRIDQIKRVSTEGGKLSVKIEDRTIPQYDRVSPFDIFPAKDSTAINDGYLIERICLRRDQIASMLKMPEDSGFITAEVREVLNEFTSGGLREWTSIDQEKEVQENREGDVHETDKIDCLEFWGPVPGKIIKAFGGEMAEKIEDEDIDYHICADLIGSHVIKAYFNLEPNGDKPYSKTSFEVQPGSFWGKGVPELIADCQSTCNACARAIVNNVGIASGPQVERNIDRIPEGENKQIYPWKVWDVTEEQMGATQRPALQFYQPPMIVEKLMNVYMTFSKIADEHSGIPAYAHGDPQVGGAGNTASGLSMLMGQAAKGIKAVVKNIDDEIISTSVARQFYDNIDEQEFYALVGDMKVVATGSASLIAKEQQAVRLNEFARTTANPIDFQITGIEGRKYILKTVAKSLELDIDKAVPEQIGPLSPPPQLNPAPTNNAPPMPGEQTLNAAGEPAQGTDFKLFQGGPTNA